MVNHFATLLTNLDMSYMDSVKREKSIHASSVLVTARDQRIVTSLYEIFLQKAYKYSVLLARNYTPVKLPNSLDNFYKLLFPENSSLYYKLFLLYSYLRIVDSTDRKDDIKKYDNRLTYDLSSIEEYFRFYKKTSPVASNQNYSLLVSGDLKTDEQTNGYKNDFVIYQQENSRNLYVYSITQSRFYKKGQAPSKNPIGMENLLSFGSSASSSNLIDIGDTGLRFVIAGPLDDFMTTSDKRWGFSAEAPFEFDFNQCLKQLEQNTRIVEEMLAFSSDKCDLSYTNLWQMHYNGVYRLAGLLLAYVQRVNIVCQNAQT